MTSESLLDNAGASSDSSGSPFISVVVCSVNPQRRERLRLHIAETIGVPHEFLVVCNEVERLGICAAYNKAAAAAVGRILCFVHEDVRLLTPQWGQRVILHFQADAELGAIGLAGSRYKSRIPSGWFCNNPQTDCANIFHGQRLESAEHGWMKPVTHASDSRVPVVVLDGVWLCVPRAIWCELRFDERIEGFHFYDLDFSLRCSQRHRVAVVYDVDLLHFSHGNFADDWAAAALRYHQVAARRLPAFCDAEDVVRGSHWERAAARFWIRFLRKKVRAMRLRWRWLRELPPMADRRDAWSRLRFLFS